VSGKHEQARHVRTSGDRPPRIRRIPVAESCDFGRKPASRVSATKSSTSASACVEIRTTAVEADPHLLAVSAHLLAVAMKQ
jgi:hypothetical protein